MSTIEQRDPLTDARQAAATDVNQRLSDYIDGLPANRRAEGEAITATLTRASVAAQAASTAHDKALENLDLHPDGRRARATQARENGTREVTEHIDDATTRADILHAALTEDALRTPPGQAEAALARQDAALILSLAEGGQAKAKALADLAGDADVGVATLAVGPWGRRYLAAAGLDPATITETMDAARTAALTAMAGRGDDARSRAARSALSIDALRAGIGAHGTLTRQTLPRQ